MEGMIFDYIHYYVGVEGLNLTKWLVILGPQSFNGTLVNDSQIFLVLNALFNIITV